VLCIPQIGRRWLACCLVCLGFTSLATGSGTQDIQLEPLGRYQSGEFGTSACEIVAYDSTSGLLFVTNASANSVIALDISEPDRPVVSFTIDLAPYGAGVNSVAVSRGRVAVAVESEPMQNPGRVVFFDADGAFESSVRVGSLPDMLTFTPDGRFVLVANEGQPNEAYTTDPEGSVSVIRVPADGRVRQRDVRTVGFGDLDPDDLDGSVRIFGPEASVARDLEPEYIAVDPDGRHAYVVAQENNAMLRINIRGARLAGIWGLGTKDHALRTNAMDASDRDGGVRIGPWPVEGYYQPDTIAAYSVGRGTFIVTANEGDARDYAGYSEVARVADIALDPDAFPDARLLQREENLGRLNITTARGDTDGDGDFDRLYTFGGRGFSIFDTRGRLVWDSGSEFERVVAEVLPEGFNSNHDDNASFDGRSDNKGPEPEALALGAIGDRTYAFIGAERVGGIFTYDISNPYAPEFVAYTSARDFSGDPAAGTAGDLGPECLVFVPGHESPIGEPLLIGAYEVSGSVAIFRIK